MRPSMALAFFVLPLLFAVVVVVGQQGFLSIDCGLDDSYSGDTDKFTGIVYVSDGAYIDAGENRRVAPDLESSFSHKLQTVRSFPSGLRNCYALPTVSGTKYLVRAIFAYGNYDGKNSSSLQFDLHLGAHYWDTTYSDSTSNYAVEAIFVAWAGWAPVCLVDTGGGTPFISVLELRQLGDSLYPLVTTDLLISTLTRKNMGATDSTTRYPVDPYDRFWWPMDQASPRWVNGSTTQPVRPDDNFAVPSSILQTAVAATGNDTALTAITWQDYTKSRSFMTYLHFADFQDTQIRQFDIYINENQSGGPTLKKFIPYYLASFTVYTETYKSTDGNYNITLAATNTSVLPPMINALEIYVRVPYETPSTLPADFDAIMAIKIEYGIKKNWMGDPCLPIKYAWYGVQCRNTTGNTTRITSLDLSNSYLRGTISKNFTLLTALENLDLSYNNLTGSIPDSLLSLPSLQVVNVSGNKLSDDTLCKNYTGSLIFRYDYDGSICNQTSSRQRKNKVAIIAISVVVPVLVVVVLLLAYFIWRERRKHNVQPVSHVPKRDLQFDNASGSIISHGDNLKKSENRLFTYKELGMFTNNFKKLIGQGGFGPVYYGRLEDNTEVAIKMRSESSSHGLDEFLAEVQSLTKVHHRNLVSLIGYCWEKYHLALVYEYMSQGSLFDHLRGTKGAGETLNWRTRVQIVLEAAQGLDYLHKGCNLPIVHRDVKTSNILLGQNRQAKIADFGLSKTYHSDTQTHISAVAAGTAGYMDPEYYLTGRLTESSDVYSFGVVLLEVATGEYPIVPGRGHIVQRVKQKIDSGDDIGTIADLQLGRAYDISSMWKVIDTAIRCTADSAAQRPTMATVVIHLKESLALEEAREMDSSIRESRGSDKEAVVSTFRPYAR